MKRRNDAFKRRVAEENRQMCHTHGRQRVRHTSEISKYMVSGGSIMGEVLEITERKITGERPRSLFTIWLHLIIWAARTHTQHSGTPTNNYLNPRSVRSFWHPQPVSSRRTVLWILENNFSVRVKRFTETSDSTGAYCLWTYWLSRLLAQADKGIDEGLRIQMPTPRSSHQVSSSRSELTQKRAVEVSEQPDTPFPRFRMQSVNILTTGNGR